MNRELLTYQEVVYEEAGMCVYSLNKDREKLMTDLLGRIIEDGQMKINENQFLTELLRIFTNISDGILDDEQFMNSIIENPSMEFDAIVSEVLKINSRYVRILKNNSDTLTNMPQESLKELIDTEAKKSVEDNEYRQYLELQAKFEQK